MAAVLLCGPAAKASSLSDWTWSSTINSVAVSGTASFSTQVDGSAYDLIITVTNTASQLPQGTANILTGLYFDISPNIGALSMYSAVADLGMLTTGAAQNTPTAGTAGTFMCAPGQGENAKAPGSACTVDGGWESAYNATGIGGGANAKQHYGIGTSGQTGVFQGSNVNTFDYGIAPGGTVGVDPSKGGGLSGAYPTGYVYGSATFVLTGLSTSAITISNVAGAYGTMPEGTPAATSVVISAIPEPTTVGMSICGALLIVLSRRRVGRR